MNDSHPSVAIVGASGAVGREAISILEARGHPHTHISLWGSSRSAGQQFRYQKTTLVIQHIDQIAQHAPDFALLCATAQTARTLRKTFSAYKTVLIDNSSAFRMDSDVPLIIPEINGHLLNTQAKVIASPNCSTILMLTATNPLRKAFGIRSISVATYQAVSGAGLAGITELRNQSRAYLKNEQLQPEIFPCSCAFNVFEHESSIDPNTGFNGEETKMIHESRRIWQEPTLRVLPTCVRVPVERAHSQAITVELCEPSDLEHIRRTLDQPGLRVLADGQSLTPRDAAGEDEVFIGRLRLDPASAERRVILWVCCDQLRKGAALNVIQIMDRLYK